MKKLRFEIFYLLFCSFLIYGAAQFSLKKTDGFSIASLESQFPSAPEWNIEDLAPEEKVELDKALSQPYHYLGFGGQCYAFESQDQKYVIKFFKHRFNRFQLKLIENSLLKPFGFYKIYNRFLSKHVRDFTSYKIAYDLLKKQTALLYIHLNKTSHLHKKLTLSDKIHIFHEIDLDQTEFLLQKKAQLVHPWIEEKIKEGNLTAIRKGIRSIFELIVSRCKMGIYDEDPKIHCNIGLLEEEAIFIDVGRFKKDDTRTNSSIYLQDLQNITLRFKNELGKKHPELLEIFEEELAKAGGPS